MTEYLRKLCNKKTGCGRIQKSSSCGNSWKAVFKLPPSGEICILGEFKYRQQIQKDQYNGKITPEIRGEKIGDQN